jgi:hypothetical protein
LVLGTLVATLGAGGCKEDDNGDDTPTDAGGNTPADSGGGGGTDSGSSADAGAKDSGASPMDAGEAKDANVMCGTLTCTEHVIAANGSHVAAGCSKSALDATVCGISTSTLGGVDAGLPEFLEKDAPGKESTSCGNYIDLLEAVPDGGAADGGPRGNHLVDVMTGGFLISYPGCCTADGFCSANTGKGKIMNAIDVNGGYGCMTPAVFLAPLVTDVAKRFIPCDPTSGEIKATDGGTSDGGSDAGASDAGADGGNG